MFTHATNAGAEYIYGEVVGVNSHSLIKEIQLADGTTLQGKSIIIASGTVEKKLGVPGEGKYYGRGVSYCAVCDGVIFRNKEVVVIGGGNSAIEEAAYLTSVVAKVHLIHRSQKFRATDSALEGLRRKTNVV
jgi:thioredoxin reductase (NADPH)